MRLKGFTVIELMIAMAIMGICVIAIFGVAASRGCTANVGSKEAALENLATYANDMGWVVKGKTCAESDSDGDGYISCTVRVKEEEGGPSIEKYLDCGSGAWGTRTGGCKPKLGVFPAMPAPAAAPAPEPR